MKLASILLALVLSGVGLTAGCGGKAERAGSASTSSASVSDTSTENPSDGVRTGEAITTVNGKIVVDPDHDDHETEELGHAASRTDLRAVTALVKRYYTTADRGNGSAGCAMIATPLAKSMPEVYGHGSGPPVLRGNTCAIVLAKLFELQHKELAAEVPTMRVTMVRIIGHNGLVILAFKTTPEPREISVAREDGAWKIGSLIDSSLP